jgi:hypothetical protein
MARPTQRGLDVPAPEAPPSAAPSPEAPPPGPPARRSRRQRALRWIKGVFGTALVLFLVLFALHWRWARRVGAELDAQLAVIRAAGEPATVEELNAWPGLVSGDGDNVVPHLRAAAGLIDGKDPAWLEYGQAVEGWLPLKDAEVASTEALLKRFDPALRAADAATVPQHSRVDWGVQYTTPMFDSLAHNTDYNDMRDLATLLKADALLAFQRGDHARALRRARQTLVLSRAIDHRPSLVGHLVALGLAAMSGSIVTEIVPELRIAADDEGAARPDEVKALIAELIDDRPLREGFRRAFVGERVLQLDAATGLADGRFDSGSVTGGKLRVPIPGAGYALRPVFRENGAIMARFMSATIAAAGRSTDWPAYVASAPPPPREADGDASLLPVRYALVRIMVPALDRVARQDYRSMADRRLAAACLAARLYAADHGGRYPDKLQDLVPDYLPSVPLDPFSRSGATLIYVNPTADPEKPRIYSVAENGDDNGGVEPDPMLSRRERDRIEDEVRHLKRQPRPKPPEFPMYPSLPPGMFPGSVPGTYPGTYPGMPPGFPGLPPPGDGAEVPTEPGDARPGDAQEPEAEEKPQGADEPRKGPQ